MQDVTNDLNQFERGLLFYNCPNGIMIGGHCGEGKTYHRRFASETMTIQAHPEQVFKRTGEIMQDELGNHIIVYRFNSK